MGRSCTVCSHPDALVINELLVIEGKSNRVISRQYGLHHDAVRRHKEHIPQLLLEAAEMQGIEQAEDLLDTMRGLHARTVAILDEAEERAELRTALGAIREVRGNVELLARLRHLIDTRPQVNILIAPVVEQAIIDALRPYPEAGYAVADALDSVKALEAPEQ
jgi:hypothetical protein